MSAVRKNGPNTPQNDKRAAGKGKTPLGKIIGGKLDLSNKNFTDSDLKKLDVLPSLRILNLANNQIHTFQYLKPQPNLKTIIATNNPIQYLNGLPEQPALESLDLTETPLAEKQSFRYLTLATVGSNLLELNGTKLTRQEQQIAEIMIRRKSDKLYLGNIDEESNDSLSQEQKEENKAEFEAMNRLYCAEQHSLYAEYFQNEAILIDLNTNGELPIIHEFSTNQDIVHATEKLKERNQVLKDIIRQKQNELDGNQEEPVQNEEEEEAPAQ